MAVVSDPQILAVGTCMLFFVDCSLMILVEKRSSREPWAVVVEESTFRRFLCQGMR